MRANWINLDRGWGRCCCSIWCSGFAHFGGQCWLEPWSSVGVNYGNIFLAGCFLVYCMMSGYASSYDAISDIHCGNSNCFCDLRSSKCLRHGLLKCCLSHVALKGAPFLLTPHWAFDDSNCPATTRQAQCLESSERPKGPLAGRLGSFGRNLSALSAAAQAFRLLFRSFTTWEMDK